MQGADSAGPPKKKLLFLDVDGVLHRLRVEFKDGKALDDHCFLPSCCQELQRVVQQTGAEIVLSSSWRAWEQSRLKVSNALASYGLSFRRWTTTQDLPGGRAAQILSFVSCEQGVGAWAVVDDEQLVSAEDQDSIMLMVLAQRFVRTHQDIGITAADADHLIKILNESSDEED